ncbi:predicted protein [Ostreococcus lucimarinus CCE9901]|uniref:Uncharacterized protein n=1 Tax=Ostreococcus lucimarinus (strain CCE9901) TaxID=436017 RepID=A4SAA3_OSTLU|nr:predicted protein [Ostreococcus lucimarinus CCE9901]ABP00623.1 predicted protein [Ostreococcus lucimarinus CCE9901]|eukprot:XP_001422306.1 predicted protein [Ostreococcus lucimarinus CCE9901]
MYEGKIMNLINVDVCRAVARHFAPRARPGGAESTDVSAYRDIRPFKFEFCAWVLTEHDRWSSMGTLTFGPDSVAYDAPSRAPKRVSDRVDGTERL